MRGNFGLKLQNSPKLPHVHARLYCDTNEKGQPRKGLFVVNTKSLQNTLFFVRILLLPADEAEYSYFFTDFRLKTFV